MHNGRAAIGAAAPNYKHGKYSKYLPTRLSESYVEALNDPDLLSLRSEIAITDARLADLLGKIDSGELGNLWRKLKNEWDSFTYAAKMVASAKTPEEGKKWRAAQNESYAKVNDLINDGVSDWRAWQEIGKQVDRRNRLVTSDRKRLVEMNQIITNERATAMLSVILSELTESVKLHVTDKAIGRQILFDASTSIRRFVARGDG